jgi:hypothetical protein
MIAVLLLSAAALVATALWVLGEANAANAAPRHQDGFGAAVRMAAGHAAAQLAPGTAGARS